MAIDLAPLAVEDLPRLHGWLNDPEVVHWWEGDDVSWDAIVREYDPTAAGPVEHWIARLDGEPVGWLQCYPTTATADEEETRQWRALGVGSTAAGIDYLVGDASQRGRGIGTAMIRAFVVDALARHPEWTRICASPQAANTASCRALAKAGFTEVGVFMSAHGACQLFALDRAALDGSRSGDRPR